MSRTKSPSVLHMVWRVTYYAQMVADALRTGHYGLAIRLGRVLREAERNLKRGMAVVLLVPVSLLGGCVALRGPDVADVAAAIGRPVSVEYGGESGWETSAGRVIVRLDKAWTWEPTIYHMGAIAGLACQAADADPAKVAEKLGLPNWAMWDGSPATSKVEATRQQARLETMIPRQWHWADTAPGWPTNYHRQ